MVKIKSMNVSVRGLPLLTFAFAVMISPRTSCAQTSVATNPVGYVQLTCSGAADTIISVPFQQPAAYVGLVTSVSGSTVTLSGTPGLTTSQFLYSVSGTTYYAQMGPATVSGTDSWDGSYYTIVANGSNTLTVSTNGNNISTVPAGSTVSVIPYWTVGTVFPPSASGTAFIASSALTTQTQILLPNISGSGTGLGVANTYFFYSGAWRKDNYPIGNSYNDDIIIPDTYMTVRNPTTTTTLTTMGNVDVANFMVGLVADGSGAQDNPVAIPRPVPTTLDNLGLITSGVFQASPSPLTINDELLVLSNTSSQFSPPPVATYYYYAGTSGTGWQENNYPFTFNYGSSVIPPGAGFIIRKVAVTNGTTAFWQNPPVY